jgi:hypothetical protein
MAVTPTDMVVMSDLGDSEAQDQTGIVIPGEITVNFVGGFGHGIGQIELWSGSKRSYVVDTPVLPVSDPAQPELFSGVRHLMLGGAKSLCGFGSVQGPNQVAGIWCRPESGGAWQTVAAFKNALSLVAMLPDTTAAQRSLLVDVAGTVYVSQGNTFKASVSAAINVGCSPPCAAFQTAAIPPASANPGRLRAVIAGSSAQVLAIHDDGNAITLAPVDSVSAALFGDERPMGMSAARFTTAAYGPDGSLWLATGAPIIMLKLSPDLSSASRICLPSAAQGMGINTMVVGMDGRIILGLSPALLGFGRWQ